MMRPVLNLLRVALLLAVFAVPARAADELTSPAEFINAFNSRDVATLKTVLEKNPALASGTNSLGKPWLFLAAEQAHTNLVELLLSAKADVNARTPDGSTPLHSVIPNEPFVARPPARVGAQAFEDVDEDGNVVRMSSTVTSRNTAERQRVEREERQLAIVGMLAAAGARPFATNGTTPGDTPVARAIQFKQTNHLDRLLMTSSRVADRDADGDTLMHIAVKQARFQAFSALGANKADFNITNAAGLTPMQALVLHSAPPAASRDSVEPDEPPGFFTLLAAGARLDPFSLAGLGKVAELTHELKRDAALVRARDAQGRALLHWAAMKGNKAAVSLLLSRGAAVSDADYSKRLPLHEAAARGYAPVLEQLITNGATMNARDATGASALELAAEGGHEVAVAFLLSLKPELEPRSPGLATALHRAVDSQNAKLVESLLAAGVKPDARDGQQQTPLHHATVRAETNIVARLVAAGVDVNAREVHGNTPLYFAAAGGRVAIVEALLAGGVARGLDVSAANLAKQTPLDIAIKNGSDQIASLLLARGAKAAPVPNGDTTPLHLAARTGNLRLAELILKGGANANATNEAGVPPFIVAATNGHVQVMELLLAAGADLNARDANGNTALMLSLTGRPEYSDEPPMDGEWAALLRLRVQQTARAWIGVLDPESPLLRPPAQMPMAQIRRLQLLGRLALPQAQAAALVAAPAAVDAPVREATGARKPVAGWRELLVDRIAQAAGLRGMDLGSEAPVMVWEQWRQKPWRYLMAAGADPRGANARGQTALHLVAQWQYWNGMPSSHTEVPFSMLVRLGADVNARDAEGQTVLHVAAKAGNDPLTRVLVEAKAGLDVTNKLGQTPLHLAATSTTYGSASTKLLVEAGANVNAQDRDGNTPLHLAAANYNQRDSIKLMMERKANRHLPNAKGETPFQVGQRSGIARDAFNPPGVKYSIVEAARLADLDTAKVFLSDDPKFAQTTGPSGIRALHWAAQLGNIEWIKLLLESGANVNGRETNASPSAPTEVITTTTTSPDGGVMRSTTSRGGSSTAPATPLQLAAVAGKRDAAKFLIENGAEVDVHTAATLGLIPILEKLIKESPDRVKEIVSRGTMLHTVLTNGWRFTPSHNPRSGTPLHFAIHAGERPAAEWLLEHGADAKTADAVGHRPLYHAMKAGDEKMAELLTRNGATLDLFTAISLGKKDKVAALLAESPAQLEATNSLRLPPLAWAVIEDQKEIAALFIASNAPVNGFLPERSTATPLAAPPVVGRGATVLHVAAAKNLTNIGALLIAHGADVNVMDQQGNTPLHFAAAFGGTEFAALLLTNKAEVNARLFPPEGTSRTAFTQPKGNTPLHIAALYGREATVELLLARGADIHATNNAGYTAVALSKFGASSASIPSLSLTGLPGMFTPEGAYGSRAVVDLLVRHGAVEPARPPSFSAMLTTPAVPVAAPVAPLRIAPRLPLLRAVAPQAEKKAPVAPKEPAKKQETPEKKSP